MSDNNYVLKDIKTADSVSNHTNQTDQFEGLEPFVRYGFPEGADEDRQRSRLQHTTELIPDEATTVSPIYWLTDDQQTFNDKDEPYAVKSASCVGKYLQKECRQEERYLHHINVESDGIEKGHPPQDVRAALSEFVTNALNIEPTECCWFFSGNRSIHCHTPLFVTNGAKLDVLRQRVKTFNEEHEIEIDPMTLSRDWQFRLPSVEHEATGMRKVPIDPDGTVNQLRRQMIADPPELDTYADVVEYFRDRIVPTTDTIWGYGREWHGRTSSENTSHEHVQSPPLISTAGDGNRRVNTLESEERTKRGYINQNDGDLHLSERRSRPKDPATAELWDRWNANHFSPYANANGRRSVAIIEVKGGAFCCDIDGEHRQLVPAYIYGAIGANGEWMVWRKDAPIKLSQRDYRKWRFEKGDTVVIIGGRSRNSRLIRLVRGGGPNADSSVSVTMQRRAIVGALLSDQFECEEDGRRDAFDALTDFGYDVGSAGLNGDRKSTSYESESGKTNAVELQCQAEINGIKTLTHEERLHVGNRILRIHEWEGAMEWFKNQFGEEFDPKTTRTYLTSIATKFDDLLDPPSKADLI